jgi:hypothetical protein
MHNEDRKIAKLLTDTKSSKYRNSTTVYLLQFNLSTHIAFSKKKQMHKIKSLRILAPVLDSDP